MSSVYLQRDEIFYHNTQIIDIIESRVADWVEELAYS